MSIEEILNTEDPLSEESMLSLINHGEEDNLVDYKVDFDPTSEKAWLGITVDILAFHNTFGGFLVFGVEDNTFEKKGLQKNILTILCDTNKILQKINRFIEPEISRIRSKKITLDGLDFAIIYIPNSNNITFMIKKDGSFKYPSGEDKILFRKGTTYIRRSAGNHLVDSRDLDLVFNKRLEKYRKTILSNITRVIEAPKESNVFIVSKDESSPDVEKFIIEDSPDAIPVKGMSFSVEPKTDEQEIASSIALNKRTPLNVPHKHTLWGWYKKRDSISLSSKQMIYLAKFGIIHEVPVFYWLQNCNASDIKLMLEDVLKYEGSSDYYSRVLIVAHFLGKGPFNYFVKKLGKNVEKVSRSKKKYVKDDVFSIVNMGKLGSKTPKKASESEIDYKKRLLDDLNEKVDAIIDSNPRTPNYILSDDIFSYDCRIYSRLDKYHDS